MFKDEIFQLVTYTRVIEKWSDRPSMTHILICCSRNHNSVSLAIFSDSMYLFKATIHHAYFLPRELGLSEQFLKGNWSRSLLSSSCTLEVEEGLFRSRWIWWRSHLYLILSFLSNFFFSQLARYCPLDSFRVTPLYPSLFVKYLLAWSLNFR